MIANLSRGEDYLQISNFYYYKNDEKRGISYNNTTFEIAVQSGNFCGVGQWECDFHAFASFVETLEQMYHFQAEHVVLEDTLYGSKVGISIDKTGHLTVSGTLYGRTLIHSLVFSFEADQTCLEQFVCQ